MIVGLGIAGSRALAATKFISPLTSAGPGRMLPGVRCALRVLKLLVVTAVLGVLAVRPSPASGLSCGVTASMPPNSAELAIAGGWPEGAPYAAVLIGTVLAIDPEQGDAAIFGDTLTIRVDALLVGELPLPTVTVFNPPTGGPGWLGFEAGRTYLIAAFVDKDHGLSTGLCTPNQRVDSRKRFDYLVSIATNPVVPDTSTTSQRGVGPRLPALGLALLLLAATPLGKLRRSVQGR